MQSTKLSASQAWQLRELCSEYIHRSEQSASLQTHHTPHEFGDGLGRRKKPRFFIHDETCTLQQYSKFARRVSGVQDTRSHRSRLCRTRTNTRCLLSAVLLCSCAAVLVVVVSQSPSTEGSSDLTPPRAVQGLTPAPPTLRINTRSQPLRFVSSGVCGAVWCSVWCVVCDVRCAVCGVWTANAGTLVPARVLTKAGLCGGGGCNASAFIFLQGPDLVVGWGLP